MKNRCPHSDFESDDKDEMKAHLINVHRDNLIEILKQLPGNFIINEENIHWAADEVVFTHWFDL